MTPLEVMACYEALDAACIGGTTLIEKVRNVVRENERLAAEVSAARSRTDREALLAELGADRSQVLTLLGDVSLDDPAHEQEAPAWHWLASQHKWPTRTFLGWRWYAGSCWYAGNLRKESDQLPVRLIAVLSLGTDAHPTRYFESPRAALEAVVEAITAGHWTVEDD